MIKAMPKAEAQRILECRVSRIHFDTKEETDTFSTAIQNNYGHAGESIHSVHYEQPRCSE